MAYITLYSSGRFRVIGGSMKGLSDFFDHNLYYKEIENGDFRSLQIDPPPIKNFLLAQFQIQMFTQILFILPLI